jgi:signal transduction histidine kinase
MGFEAETLDLSVMLRSVGASLESLARSRFAKILLAVNPGYMVRADRSALQMTLSETIATAVRAAPGGQVLISVRQLGPQLNVLITDDGADADQKLRESMVRGAGELLALQGGTISVEARPGRGTTVTLRLPVFAGSASGATAASGFDAPGRARAGHSVEPAGGYVMAEDALSDYELVLAS